ncbi:MAG: DUF4418 family protein [Gaiellales bacterium]|nr:MAG: DUF4418 family protein [Gaiellales bacterium]
MSKTTRFGAGGAIAALGALVFVTPRYLFPVCEYFGVRMEMMGKTSPMQCYYTARASLLVGAIIVLAGIAVMIATRPEALRSLALVVGGAGIGVILIPTVLFPVCHNADMHCNQGAVPLLIVLGVTTLIMSGWLALASRKSSMEVSEAAV